MKAVTLISGNAKDAGAATAASNTVTCDLDDSHRVTFTGSNAWITQSEPVTRCYSPDGTRLDTVHIKCQIGDRFVDNCYSRLIVDGHRRSYVTSSTLVAAPNATGSICLFAFVNVPMGDTSVTMSHDWLLNGVTQHMEVTKTVGICKSDWTPVTDAAAGCAGWSVSVPIEPAGQYPFKAVCHPSGKKLSWDVLPDKRFKTLTCPATTGLTASEGISRAPQWTEIPPYMPFTATPDAAKLEAQRGALRSFDPNSYLNCVPSLTGLPWSAEAIDATQKANLWAADICAKYDEETCAAYWETLRCRGYLVSGWYNGGTPDVPNPAEYLCVEGFDSPLFWQKYHIDTITPAPYFYVFDGNRIEVPYVGVLVRRNGEYYIAQLELGVMNGAVPVWEGLPPVDPGCRTPGAKCRLWFRAPCLLEREPVVVEKWIPAEPTRVRPSGSIE